MSGTDVPAVAIVLGGGRGERLGLEEPKALVRVAGRSLLSWSARALARARGVGAVICVIPDGASAAVDEIRSDWSGPATLGEPVAGGPARQASVARGVAAAVRQFPSAQWVLVHDAARCLVEPRDAEAVLVAARESGAAIPVVSLSDTVKRVAGEHVEATLDRERLAAAQTSQGFRIDILREALDKAARDDFTGTDCSSLVERLGVAVRIVSGRVGNAKVTDRLDLDRVRRVLESAADAVSPASDVPEARR